MDPNAPETGCVRTRRRLVVLGARRIAAPAGSTADPPRIATVAESVLTLAKSQ